MCRLNNKVALVTGAASKQGFGHAISVRLARDGADIVILDKYNVSPHDKDKAEGWKGLDSVKEEIEAVGKRAFAVTCDITKSEQVSAMVEIVLDKFEHIDILVNNAAVHIFGEIEHITDEIWDMNIAVNLTGTFFCSRAVAREMIKNNRGGKIINIASDFGKVGSGNGNMAYCASKFGVLGLTQSLALELALYNIAVNSVCPSFANTSLGDEHLENQARLRDMLSSELREQLVNQRIAANPLGRLTAPADVANMVAFLASEEASYITGQSLNVNGGLLMSL